MANWTTPVTFRDVNVKSYEVDDLNRVEQNTQYLSDWLNSIGYTNTIVTDYTWGITEFFKASDDTRYMSNLNELKAIVSITDIVIPDTLENITKTTANNIEKLQQEVYDRIIRIENNRIFASFNAGTNRVRQYLQRG